mmetsp:Transcript_13107/g.30161  ORF Transcript_13107/g.30161 Transcript_13107/m.30161 type:complete len:276 (-) Transcript_13107:1523-2350(-)
MKETCALNISHKISSKICAGSSKKIEKTRLPNRLATPITYMSAFSPSFNKSIGVLGRNLLLGGDVSVDRDGVAIKAGDHVHADELGSRVRRVDDLADRVSAVAGELNRGEVFLVVGEVLDVVRPNRRPDKLRAVGGKEVHNTFKHRVPDPHHDLRVRLDLLHVRAKRLAERMDAINIVDHENGLPLGLCVPAQLRGLDVSLRAAIFVLPAELGVLRHEGVKVLNVLKRAAAIDRDRLLASLREVLEGRLEHYHLGRRLDATQVAKYGRGEGDLPH